jgi:hypothetical protein
LAVRRASVRSGSILCKENRADVIDIPLPGLACRLAVIDTQKTRDPFGVTGFVKLLGAEGETRTRMGIRPPPPQDGVSTNSTTSAKGSCFLTD